MGVGACLYPNEQRAVAQRESCSETFEGAMKRGRVVGRRKSDGVGGRGWRFVTAWRKEEVRHGARHRQYY